jgi:hypothetical protein
VRFDKFEFNKNVFYFLLIGQIFFVYHLRFKPNVKRRYNSNLNVLLDLDSNNNMSTSLAMAKVKRAGTG